MANTTKKITGARMANSTSGLPSSSRMKATNCRRPARITVRTRTDRALQRSCGTSSLPSLSRTKAEDDGAPRRRFGQSLFAVIAPGPGALGIELVAGGASLALDGRDPSQARCALVRTGRCRRSSPAPFLSPPCRVRDLCFASEIIAQALPNRRLSRRRGRRILFDDALLTRFTNLQ